MLRYMFGIKTI